VDARDPKEIAEEILGLVSAVCPGEPGEPAAPAT
jgi:hypothetical protein